MTPKELRIGNLVLIKDDTEYENYIWTVSGISENGLGLKCKIGHIFPELDKVKPIQLTEEILLKCGFEKRQFNEHTDVYRKANIDILYNIANGFEYIHSSGGGFFTKVNSLHQLQNIYSALTGRELEVELWR